MDVRPVWDPQRAEFRSTFNEAEIELLPRLFGVHAN